MRYLAILILVAMTFAVARQTFTCSTAFTHAHDNVKEAQIVISTWSGCTVAGTVSGVAIQLWADGSTCPLRSKVPGTFYVRYDATCGQVLDLSDAPLPPLASCPSPSPTAQPTPTPAPSPTPSQGESSDGLKGTSIIDANGAAWTLGLEKETLRNSVAVGRGAGVLYKYLARTMYVLGTDSRTWYRWNGNEWVEVGQVEPNGASPTPIPTPTPATSPTPSPTLTPRPSLSPSPTPSPSPAKDCRSLWKPWQWLKKC